MMTRATLAGVSLGAVLAFRTMVGAHDVTAHSPDIAEFLAANPGTAVSQREGRVRRVFGSAFATGTTAAESVDWFVQHHAAALFGIDVEQLVPIGPTADGRHVQPIMYQRETGTHKFTAYFYTQQVDGIPVFQSQLRLLVRNEPGYPLVLASANLFDLAGFAPNAGAAGGVAAQASLDAAMQRASDRSSLAGAPEVMSSRKVIWAGAGAPVVADETVVGVDADRWLVITDAATGEVLHEEQQICLIDIVGTVHAYATGGVATDDCEEELLTPLAYLQVFAAGVNMGVSDINGDVIVPYASSDPVDVHAALDGAHFNVFSWIGAEEYESQMVSPPGPAQLLFNEENDDADVRAQVNAYVHANIIRDYVLEYSPTFPAVFDNPDMRVWVNRADGFCPGNAWYEPSDQSLNFCMAMQGWGNMAYSSIIYHEYGHHLVDSAGGDQAEYGEGIGDAFSALILDDPRIGEGLLGPCVGGWARNADNSCLYSGELCSSCGETAHQCGNLLSGAVWSTRNELALTEPADYLEILSNITVNSVLLHTDSSITSDITVDFLTLDDDDAEILNGTPHYTEIDTGFSAHLLDAPEIHRLTFDFPNGLPETVCPSGGTVVDVEVNAFTETPQPGTGTLIVDSGEGFTAIPMNETAPNVYEAVFPAIACGEIAPYYFTAETTESTIGLWPLAYPEAVLSVVGASAPAFPFEDDFETDQGWSVVTTGFDGAWERDVPIPHTICNRGNPDTDADGSGQCYLTDNDSANECNSDVDGGYTVLTSPIMDASQGNAVITYWRWFHNTEGHEPMTDVMDVEVSDNAGASWALLETVGPTGPEVTGGWVRKSFKVSDVVSPTDQFQIRFFVGDFSIGSIVEAGVDGVKLIDAGCGAADVDCDGVVGVSDLLIVLGNWGPCPGPCPPACVGDLDQDCSVGVSDLLTLLGAWSP